MEWLRGDLDVFIGLFFRIGLMANVADSKIMMCYTGVIRSVILKEMFGRKSTGKGDTYWEWLWCRLLFPDCGMDLMVG